MATVQTAVPAARRTTARRRFSWSSYPARVDVLLGSTRADRCRRDLRPRPARGSAPWVDTVFVPGLDSLLYALERRDPYTWRHSQRVCVLVQAIGWELGLDGRTVACLGLAGLVHDIGKLGVPRRILQKTGPLTALEYREVARHMTYGERLLRPILGRHGTILEIVRSHHERMDGAGAPDGLCGRSIPVGARIVAVADAFDAMVSSRPYRLGRLPEEALKELRAHTGSQFDPLCVRALSRVAECALRSLPVHLRNGIRMDDARYEVAV